MDLNRNLQIGQKMDYNDVNFLSPQSFENTFQFLSKQEIVFFSTTSNSNTDVVDTQLFDGAFARADSDLETLVPDLNNQETQSTAIATVPFGEEFSNNSFNLTCQANGSVELNSKDRKRRFAHRVKFDHDQVNKF